MKFYMLQILHFLHYYSYKNVKLHQQENSPADLYNWSLQTNCVTSTMT